jgi:glutathione synthase
MKIAFILDPLDKLKAYKDSSIAMMRAAARRDHQVFAIQREALVWDGSTVSARSLALTPTDDNNAWYVPGTEEVLPLTAFDAVLMRQDPPFDFEYVTATWLLESAANAGARIFNNPASIRDHSEKLAILEFPQFIPPTRVARAAVDINAFIDAHGDTILKPLDGMGGSQIFRVRADDPNRNVIIETLTHEEGRTIMAQAYLPAISSGDKRVLIIGGKVIPHSLARIPKEGETRGNLAAGGRGVAMPLTDGERAVAEYLAPILWGRGLLIVGLDLIGDRLTEINVTSPTCMAEIADQTGFDVASVVIDSLEATCA